MWTACTVPANPDTGAEKELAFAGTLEDGNLPLMSDPYTYVIDNGDYEELDRRDQQDMDRADCHVRCG